MLQNGEKASPVVNAISGAIKCAADVKLSRKIVALAIKSTAGVKFSRKIVAATIKCAAGVKFRRWR